MRTMSEAEAPLESKNLNFGNTLLLGSHERSHGWRLMMLGMSESGKPWVLKKLRTESGFSEVLKWTCLEALRADSGENPKLLMR